MITSTTLSQIVLSIIKEQALIIGPLAWVEAGKVSGINIINQSSGEVALESTEPKEVINRLVARYERLFGKLSHEICKEAVHDIVVGLPKEEVPSSLL